VNKLTHFYLLILISCLTIYVSDANSADYKLGPGDKIEISVFGEKDLSISVLLGNSGKINYPFLGEISLVGLSVKQVENMIVRGLKGDYLINPNVSAYVSVYRPFYIHGQVKKPGAYPYQPGLTINQAVALAGGLTERASVEKIFLFKDRSKGQQIKASLSTVVFAGDTITIQQRFF